MQATISDKRYLKVGSDGKLQRFVAGVPAIYDYYPFGMLMKERCSMDTVGQSAYLTQVVVVPAYHKSLPNLSTSMR